MVVNSSPDLFGLIEATSNEGISALAGAADCAHSHGASSRAAITIPAIAASRPWELMTDRLIANNPRSKREVGTVVVVEAEVAAAEAKHRTAASER